MDAFAQMILNFVQQYPIVGSILMVIGVLRVCMKPLFSVFHAFVDATPSPADNEVLQKVEDSSFMKSFLYILDWFGSIKLKV